MGLTWPWMLLVWALIVAAVALVTALVVMRRSPAATRTGQPIAHSERLTGLPAYRRALRRYRVGLVLLAATLIVLLAAAVTLAARPSMLTVRYPELANRDIVLCLDVSGSMVEYDAALVSVFSDLVKEFDGERIGLVVFNASAVTYFPLTSDYPYIAKQLATIGEQFESDDAAYFDGTFFGDGSSLIGDGLAACTLRFDGVDQDVDRSRSIILATDNVLVGTPIFTLPEAGVLSESKGIRVYGLNPSDAGADDYLADFADEYRRVMENTGGGYFEVRDADTVPSIIARIEADQATVSRGSGQVLLTDVPAPLGAVAIFGLIPLLLLAWRVRP